jgi:4-hydroxybenzoyl-CoA thioesterase
VTRRSTHRFGLQIRFGDIDSAGIVYSPRYLHFCHIGMEEYFAAVVGVPYPELISGHGLGLPAVRSEVDHRRPIRFRDPVELAVEVVRVGGSSVEWRYRFFPGGAADDPATDCRVVTVLVEMRGFTKRPVPDWLRKKLLGHI